MKYNIKNYVIGKGVFVGRFAEKDLSKGKDKIAIKNAKEDTGLKYINCFDVKDKGAVAIDVYVCQSTDCKDF